MASGLSRDTLSSVRIVNSGRGRFVNNINVVVQHPTIVELTGPGATLAS
jgi:hypothetical protein